MGVFTPLIVCGKLIIASPETHKYLIRLMSPLLNTKSKPLSRPLMLQLLIEQEK